MGAGQVTGIRYLFFNKSEKNEWYWGSWEAVAEGGLKGLRAVVIKPFDIDDLENIRCKQGRGSD